MVTFAAPTVERGTGSSDDASAAEAGRRAATEAVAALAGRPPSLVLVYASVRYDLPELLAGVRSVTGSAPLAGATSAGHFIGRHVAGPGEGVAVLVLAGGPYRFGVAVAEGMAAGARAVGADVARSARVAAGAADDQVHAALLLLTDGLGGDQQAVLAGAHSVAGARVPVVGGAAGDDRRMHRTSVFCGDRVLSDAAVGVWIASTRPLHVTSGHGWSPVSLPQVVTRAEGLVVHEIGGRRATDVYAEYADLSAGEVMRRSDGLVWQASYALGVLQHDGSHLVRGVFPTADGPLHSFTPIPELSAVQVMSADVPAVLGVVEDVVGRAIVHGDERVLLTFDCTARMDILGTHLHEEVASLQDAAGTVVPFGFYTYGEFARTRGVGGVHNATLTALAL